MKYTSNLNLKKPEQDDFYNIENENDNMEIIDSEFYKKADKTTVLSKTNTDEFTPTQPYHPSTKKYVDDSIAEKVDKEDGKVLSSNDYTDAEKADVAKIKNIQTNLDNKASIGEVLRINVPNNAFTPIQPYHPATKKYVDDSVAGKAPAYTYGTTDLTAGVSALKAGVLYFVYE